MLINIMLYISLANAQIVDKELLPTYNSFYKECNKRKVRCKMANLRFDPYMKYKFQLSGFGDRESNTSWINKTAYDSGSREYKDILVYHELGHVVLSREHCDKVSIMNKNLVDELEYLTNKDVLLDELFKGKC